jgi:hypothetical protein
MKFFLILMIISPLANAQSRGGIGYDSMDSPGGGFSFLIWAWVIIFAIGGLSACYKVLTKFFTKNASSKKASNTQTRTAHREDVDVENNKTETLEIELQSEHMVNQDPKRRWFHNTKFFIPLLLGSMLVVLALPLIEDKNSKSNNLILSYINQSDSNLTFDNGWVYEGSTLPTNCFEIESISSENYKSYREIYPEIKDFSNLGQYFGSVIKKMEPIATSISSCKAKSPELLEGNPDGWINYFNESHTSGYKVLASVGIQECDSLAPYIQAKCNKSFLLHRRENGGGSLTWGAVWIYGLFQMADGRKYVVPLKQLD